MTKPADRRQKKRADADRKRQVTAARAATLAEEAAARAEAIAEEMAPRAQRVTGKVEADQKRGGFRRVDPLRKMAEQSPRLVTKTHIRCADRFSLAYEVGVLGGVGGRMGEWIDGGAGQAVPERQLTAIQEYRSACDTLGASLRTPVQCVVLHRWSLAAVAELLQMSEQRASGFLIAGLDRLVEHYEPERPARCVAPVEALVVDATVTDIPQVRLGRAGDRKISPGESCMVADEI